MTLLTLSTTTTVVFEKEQSLRIDLASGQCVAEGIEEEELVSISGDGTIVLEFKDEYSNPDPVNLRLILYPDGKSSRLSSVYSLLIYRDLDREKTILVINNLPKMEFGWENESLTIYIS